MPVLNFQNLLNILSYMDLPPATAAFVLHFGEMGSRWGINRTVGQIYALLFLSERPLNADEIVASLGFSRSNVSMSLKELETWRLVRLQHLPGDRREHFSTPEDVWQIVRILALWRRKADKKATAFGPQPDARRVDQQWAGGQRLRVSLPCGRPL